MGLADRGSRVWLHIPSLGPVVVAFMCRMVHTAALGYNRSQPAERALFGMTGSFAVTIALSRGLNEVLERRRTMRKARRLARKTEAAWSSDEVRIHHFLPGIVIGFTAGAVAILSRGDELGTWLSVPFGVGVALTSDEGRLLAGRGDPYWGNQGFALVQSAASGLAAAALSMRFICRGRAGPHSP